MNYPHVSTPRVFALAMLNGSLEESAVAPFLDELWAANYRGICLHPRDGLRVPYNGRAYWTKIERIIEMCRERGFAIWHYDEFPFPSGMGGGILLEDHPENCTRGLEFHEVDATPNSDGLIDIGRGSLLALLRYHMENGRKTDVRDVTCDTGSHLDTWVWGHWHNRYYTGTLNIHEELHERGVADRFVRAYSSDEPLRADEKLLAVKLVTQPGRVGLPGKADVSRPEVTELFLETVYARLADLSRRHELGQTPVFQDEVTFGAAWPWNDEISSRLNWNESLAQKLAGLHAPDVDGWELARCEYRAACSDAIEANWFVRVADYCRSYGMQMTGHLPGEESILGHCQLMGNAFKTLRHFDIPGYDIISSTIADDLNRGQATGAKLVQSVAWSEGRKATMVEVFGANGFHNDLQKNRSVLAWLAVHDLTNVFDHSAYQSIHGARKYDAPPVHTALNPLWSERAQLWNWHNWFCDLLEEYKFHPRTLILFPVESLARYSLGEEEAWREEVALLETWFHTACVASLDCVFVPSHRLDEVRADADGFHFADHVFGDFLIPPVASFQKETFEKLKVLAQHPRLTWNTKSTPESRRTLVEVFGESGTSECEIPTACVVGCDEKTLLQAGANWFEDLVSPTGASSQRMVLSTRRRNTNGDEILVIINPHEETVSVRSDQFNESMPQPPLNLAAEMSGNEWTIAPRDVLILKRGNSQAPHETITLRPTQSRVRFAENHLSLTQAVAHLEGEESREWIPAPVSGIWKLDVPYADSDAVFAVPYSREKLPQARRFHVEWPVEVAESLSKLAIVLDEDSLPPNAQVFWNDVELQKQSRAVFDRDNSIYVVPNQALNVGTHHLRMEAVVDDARDGVLERPILTGKFLVQNGVLHAMPEDWIPWSGESFGELGLPEGFAAEYEFVFDVPQESQGELYFEPFIGTARIEVNGQPSGASCWEPRRVPVDLQSGENKVRVALRGSWNNVWSQLNRLDNGLRGEVVLQTKSTPELRRTFEENK